MDKADPLLEELNAQIGHFTYLRRANGFLANFYIFATIMSSFAATIVSASFPEANIYGTSIKWIVFLSPLPGIFGLIRNTLGFNRRTVWFSEKATRLNAVQLRYAHGTITKDVAIDDVNAINIDMETRWQAYLMREVQLQEGAAKD